MVEKKIEFQCSKMHENEGFSRHFRKMFVMCHCPKKFHTPSKQGENFSYPDKTGLKIFIPPNIYSAPTPGIKNDNPLSEIKILRIWWMQNTYLNTF